MENHEARRRDEFEVGRSGTKEGGSLGRGDTFAKVAAQERELLNHWGVPSLTARQDPQAFVTYRARPELKSCHVIRSNGVFVGPRSTPD